jgi:ribose transport system permease protein
MTTPQPAPAPTSTAPTGSDADPGTLAIPGPVTPQGKRRLLVGDLTRRWAVVALWIVMAGVFAISSPDTFLNVGTAQIIFGAHGELVFLCLALLCAFSVGEFDFSVASVMGLSGTATAIMYTQHHWNIALAAIFGLVLALAAGSLTGFVVVTLGVDPIITTLGMATALEGAALWLANLAAVSGLPTSFADIATNHLLGLPLFFWYGVVAVAVFAYVLHFTPLGRHMMFVGANREVARLAGIRVNRIRFGAFVFSGLLSGLAGVLVAANIGGFDPSSSEASLLPALAATFLGTAILLPGRFNPVGAWIAVFFLETGIVGLQLIGLSGWISDAFFGGSLVIAVTVSTILRRRSALR